MKRYIMLSLSLALAILLLSPVSSVYAYPGGLLNGKSSVLHPGSWDVNLGNEVKMTDNDLETYYTLKPEVTNLTDIDNAYIDLGADYTITGYFQKSDRTLVYSFFDSNKNLLSIFTSNSTQDIQDISEIKHVRYVNWGNRSTVNSNVYEVDVFGYLETSPEEPEEPIHDSALLTIYISGGQIKEYDLSAAELSAFLSWFDAKDAGNGPAKYAFTKTWNKGPFKKRTEYVIFDKILTFDVDEYDVVNP